MTPLTLFFYVLAVLGGIVVALFVLAFLTIVVIKIGDWWL